MHAKRLQNGRQLSHHFQHSDIFRERGVFIQRRSVVAGCFFWRASALEGSLRVEVQHHGILSVPLHCVPHRAHRQPLYVREKAEMSMKGYSMGKKEPNIYCDEEGPHDESNMEQFTIFSIVKYLANCGSFLIGGLSSFVPDRAPQLESSTGPAASFPPSSPSPEERSWLSSGVSSESESKMLPKMEKDGVVKI